MYKNRKNIETRMYLLDSKNVSNDLFMAVDKTINTINLLFGGSIQNDYMLIKTIVNETMCKVINDSTDASCRALSSNADIVKFMQQDSTVRPIVSEFEKEMLIRYGDVFKFNADQIVNIDTILAGSTLTVYAFIERI